MSDYKIDKNKIYQHEKYPEGVEVLIYSDLIEISAGYDADSDGFAYSAGDVDIPRAILQCIANARGDDK